MNFSSNLKKFLFNLRKKEIISENQFLESLDELKRSPKVVQDQLLPLLDMFGIQYIDSELQHLDQSLLKIDKEIKEAIQAWESGSLSREKTKLILTDLVSKKNILISSKEKFQLRIQDKVSRLRLLKKNYNFDFDRFISTFHQNNNLNMADNPIFRFNKIWPKYSTGEISDDDLSQKHQKSDEVELDLLQSLMVPITEKSGVIFNLDDVIQPIDQKFGSQSSILSHKETTREKSNENQIEILSDNQVQKESSPWDLVGLIAYDLNKKPIGLLRPPIVVDGKVYLPIVKEEPITLLTLKEEYKEIFKQTEIDLKVTTTQQIKSTISNNLNIPEEFALQPSFFNQWLSKYSTEVIPAKPRLKKVRFIEADSIKVRPTESIMINPDNLQQIRIPAWIPASGGKLSKSEHLKQKIIGMAGSDFGFIVGITHKSPFGQSIVIERKVPPSYILDTILKGLGEKDIAELRYIIAKKLNIGINEAFLVKNLWLINNQERLLISPHEIAASYYTVLPAAAFTYRDKIRAKIGVYFHSVPETFRYLVGKPLIRNQEEKGIIYGFIVQQGDLKFLWSSKDPVEIIKELGRKSSKQYVTRFQRRISLALDIPHKESLWPSNLARYFMNFIWMEEKQTLKEALSVIEERFSLEKTSFSEITEVSKDGLRCRKNPG